MENRTKEVLKQRELQSILKEEINDTKEDTPKYAVVYVLMVALFIYFFDDKMYPYFGGTIPFIKASIAFFIVIGFLLLYRKILKIKKKEKEIDKIRAKLYELLKLENSKNE